MMGMRDRRAVAEVELNERFEVEEDSGSEERSGEASTPSSEHSVILKTSPYSGAAVTINDTHLSGVTPMSVPIPSDPSMVEVCVSLAPSATNGLKDTLWDCESIPFEELMAEPEYIFEIQGIEKN